MTSTTPLESQEQVYRIESEGDRSFSSTNSETDSKNHKMYIIRGLLPEELETWADFCARVFSYKPNPPSVEYFRRHFVNDPDQGSTSLIRVAVYHRSDGGSQAIVSSCRIFLRTLSLGNLTENDNQTTVLAGGIGEVCTDPLHRLKGLSKALLRNAIAIMKERQLQVSLLHAAPPFFPVYESCGYRCSKSYWMDVDVDVTKLPQSDFTSGGKRVRRAQFPQDTDCLQRIHQQFSEQRLAGCIIRSKEYWNRYLSGEFSE